MSVVSLRGVDNMTWAVNTSLGVEILLVFNQNHMKVPKKSTKMYTIYNLYIKMCIRTLIVTHLALILGIMHSFYCIKLGCLLKEHTYVIMEFRTSFDLL